MKCLNPPFSARIGIPGDVLHAPRDGVAVEIGQGHAVGRDHGHVAVGKEEQVAGVIEDGGDVAGHKVFVFAQADHRRRALPHGDDLVQVFGGDDGERKHSHKLAHRRAHGVFQAGCGPSRVIRRSGVFPPGGRSLPCRSRW